MNTGTSGHAAEFRGLKRLLGACCSTLPPYRQFLRDVLISNRVVIQKRYSIEQAMELYEIAIEVYPGMFGSLEFHREICFRQLGGNPLEAYNRMVALLPRSSDGEEMMDPPDHVHTAAAATMNRAIQEKKIDLDEGAEELFHHTSRALQLAPGSLFPVHAQARGLITISSESESIESKVRNLQRAAHLVERSLMMITGDSEREQDRRKFEDLRSDYMVASHGSSQDGIAAFERAFDETRNPLYLSMAAKIALADALVKGKGRGFRKVDDIIRKFEKMIGDSDDIPVEMRVSRIQLDYEWRINRNSGPVWWERYDEDLRIVRDDRYLGRDPWWDFLFAVGRFHLRDFTTAESVFASLRRQRFPQQMRTLLRCKYKGDKSDPVPLEGQTKRSLDRRQFMFCPALDTDILIRDKALRGNIGENKFFNIGFTLLGPIAIAIDGG